MALGAEDGVGQGGACFANFLMGRCSRLPWRHFHLQLLYYEALMMHWEPCASWMRIFLQADFCTFYFLHCIYLFLSDTDLILADFCIVFSYFIIMY